MAEGIGTVGRDVYLYDPIALEMVVFCCRLPYWSVGREHYDAGVVGAYAYLVLGTNHAVAVYSTELRLLYHELLVAIVEHASEVGHDDFLTCRHIGSAAYYLLGLAFAEVNGGDMQVVAVGMHLARKHFAHIQSFQSAFHGLHFLKCIDLKPTRSEGICRLLRCQFEVDVFFKPFVRNIHYNDFLSILFMAQNY